MTISRFNKLPNGATGYTRPEQVKLPDGSILWFSNQYRTNEAGDMYIYTTHWYKHSGNARRWFAQRYALAIGRGYNEDWPSTPTIDDRQPLVRYGVDLAS